MSKMRFLVIFSLIFITAQAKLNQDYLYNGNDKVWASLKKPFLLELVQNGKTKAKFELPKASDSEVSGTSSGGNTFSLNIKSSKAVEGVNGTLNSATVKFDIVFDQASG